MSVTRFGVSLLKVVATIERHASHHGTERPDAKNSDVFLDDLLPKKRAGAKQITTARIAIIQSIARRCILVSFSAGCGRKKRMLFMTFAFFAATHTKSSGQLSHNTALSYTAAHTRRD